MLNDSGCIGIKYGADRRDDSFSIMKDCGIESIELPDELERFIKESVDWIIGMDFPELGRGGLLHVPRVSRKQSF